MGKIDNDYLWLHERPKRPSNLRWLALLLLIPMIGGAAWLTTTPDSGDTRVTQQDQPENKSNTRITTATVDAHIGPRHTDGQPDNAEASAAEKALSAHQSGATEIAVTPTTEQSLAQDGPLGQATTLTKISPAKTSAATAKTATQPTTNSQGQPDSSPTSPDTHEWHEISIRPGDTLSIAFNRLGLSYSESLEIAHMPEYGDRFTRGLKAGDTLRVRDDGDGHVLALEYPLDALQTLRVEPDGDDFSGEIVSTDIERRKGYATGTIGTSFYVDALDAGLSDRQIMDLVNIFGWDVDFALDIQPGDRFVVVYDELYRDGEKVSSGDILAASFISHGDEVRAVRYTNDDNQSAYYSPEGREMRKAFIRTPVDYTRISSPFNLSRKHPILNRIRRHEGTDYAAPSGTPIKATGNGRIVFRGRRGGYGNMIIIKHDSHLTTRYGHMARFSKKFGVGSTVKQGDVIGYVGMSGLATGPHLHYEFRVDGKPKDPESAPPRALPLPKEQRDDFKQHAEPLLAQLDTLTETNIARLQQDDGKRTN